MQYDKVIYNTFREHAVTDIDDIIIGETYFSNVRNDDVKTITITGLLTNKEAYEAKGIEWPEERAGADDIAWYQDSSGFIDSLRDNGVTDSPYNPWMLFTNRYVCSCCIALLNSTITYDDIIHFDIYYYGE